ncbi:MAG: N-formylglutamate amidohydrolase [Alphaproteobacteria bacterium]|nr:N-formylglutamate amidohydrolase [Alphaproteobacteria bacterium]
MHQIEPYRIVNPGAAAPVLLICDHAANAVPASLRNLDLPESDLNRHIAWDIGAEAVTLGLAARLGATAVLGSVSRLVIDLNRDPTLADAIPKESDGIEIPGNRNLTYVEITERIDSYFIPYHQAVEKEIARLGRPTLVSLHSFTPVMNGQTRPWQVGILWNQDGRLAVPLIEVLSQRPGLCVGDNLPYSGRELAYSLNRHGANRQLLHVGIELRQDEIDQPGKAEAWAEILCETLKPLVLT